jgi:prepilin-type processing-associated H-X9-DG protein
MSALTSLGEDVLIIPEEPTPQRRPRRWRRVTFRIVVAGIAGLTALMMIVGVVRAVHESRRTACADNLRRIGLAMLKYALANEEHFPAPTIARRDGTPLLSWRVALLPDLGYQSLYDRFHLDEPWDSPHNLALLAEMPPEFACPGGPGRRSGRTGYVVVVGPGTDPWSVNTPFEPTRGVDLREFIDGSSRTILVLETDNSVPWTRPEDLRWAPGGPLPHLVSPHPGGANAVFGDASIRFLKATIRPEILQSILTINGGETTGG